MRKLEFKPLQLQDLTESDLGKPVQYREKSDREFGVIVGFDQNYIYAQFNTNNKPLCLLPGNLFVPIIKNKV